MKFFFILSLPLLFISCSKDNSSGTGTSKDSTCQISSVKYVNGTDSFTTTLTYNSDGKLSKTDDGNGNISTFNYSANQIFITGAGNATFFDTTTLNQFGYIEQFRTSSSGVSFYNSFFYTADTVLSFIVFKTSLVAQMSDTSTYQFTNGDLTTVKSDGMLYTYTYYPDKPEQPADFFLINQMIIKGALAFTNKHLPKSYSGNGFSTDFKYTFDAAGKITSISEHYTNGQLPGTTIYYYTYACHL